MSIINIEFIRINRNSIINIDSEAVERGLKINDCMKPNNKNIVQQTTPTTVSYTHLDVYKRQVCVCVCVCVL